MATLVYEDFPGNTTEYSVNFEYLNKSDVYVSSITEEEKLIEILTDWTWKDDTTIQFSVAPGGIIRVFRSTNIDEPISVFYPSVAIRAVDLNNNFDQLLFSQQEMSQDIDNINIEIDGIDKEIDSINDIISELAGVDILADVPELNAFVPGKTEEAVVIIDSSDWFSVTVGVSNTPAGFIGGKNLRVNLRTTQVEPPQYVFINYSPADPDERYVELTGDVMTGQLGLPGGGGATEAIQKQEVETLISTIPAAPVSSVNTKTGAVVLNAADVGALPIVGGELTGPLTSTSTATFTGDVTANKFIGDGSLLTNLPGGGGGSSNPTYIGDNPPADPQAGDQWWSTKDGENTLYVYYDDGNTSQWVIAVPASSGGGGGSGDYLPLTGGDLTGPLTSTSSITAAGLGDTDLTAGMIGNRSGFAYRNDDGS